jgi:5'-deoxynucleotidase YfbR-like HD superfamily hydrolase
MITPHILTASGIYFSLDRPDPATIYIADIAHALSQLCRFTGHCRELYSVAQHSYVVSQLVPPEERLAGLLHDAAEAYLGDVSSPLKQLLPQYQALEGLVHQAICVRFGISPKQSDDIKRADLIMLATEKRDLMGNRGGIWPILDGIEPMPRRITPWPAFVAKKAFLDRFHELYVSLPQAA